MPPASSPDGAATDAQGVYSKAEGNSLNITAQSILPIYLQLQHPVLSWNPSRGMTMVEEFSVLPFDTLPFATFTSSSHLSPSCIPQPYRFTLLVFSLQPLALLSYTLSKTNHPAFSKRLYHFSQLYSTHSIIPHFSHCCHIHTTYPVHVFFTHIIPSC